MAFTDWREMFSLARRTELMPCINASSRSVACLPMVSRKLTACASSALVRWCVLSTTAVSMAAVERMIDSSNMRSRSAKASSSDFVRSMR